MHQAPSRPTGHAVLCAVGPSTDGSTWFRQAIIRCFEFKLTRRFGDLLAAGPVTVGCFYVRAKPGRADAIDSDVFARLG